MLIDDVKGFTTVPGSYIFMIF